MCMHILSPQVGTILPLACTKPPHLIFHISGGHKPILMCRLTITGQFTPNILFWHVTAHDKYAFSYGSSHFLWKDSVQPLCGDLSLQGEKSKRLVKWEVLARRYLHILLQTLSPPWVMFKSSDWLAKCVSNFWLQLIFGDWERGLRILTWLSVQTSKFIQAYGGPNLGTLSIMSGHSGSNWKTHISTILEFFTYCFSPAFPNGPDITSVKINVLAFCHWKKKVNLQTFLPHIPYMFLSFNCAPVRPCLPIPLLCCSFSSYENARSVFCIDRATDPRLLLLFSS